MAAADPAALSPDEARALEEAVRSYAGTGPALTITPGLPAPDPRTWRTPLRLLTLAPPATEAEADRAYDDWVHWIAGGGLLALSGVSPGTPAQHLYRRALATGKFRDLPAPGALRILHRTAACN
ncbi:hypothetical protein ACIP5Y_34150 [Nocardia sp. NPDC088792]|uniref:hypothetical protein n=1 Tax=Nocardia sp. NPDC088792 TaxID=3364332 RepID=UPI0037FE3244